jgi:hypothetical protein
MSYLPEVSGSNLAREKMTFPADFAGEINLVFIAFQRWQQRQVDSWVPLAEELVRTEPGLAYYEFPTIQPMNWFSRTFLNEGMRAGIPDPLARARTITLYLNKTAFRRGLDIPHEDDIWAILFDRKGRVLWRTSGAYTPEKGEALTAAISGVLSEALA